MGKVISLVVASLAVYSVHGMKRVWPESPFSDDEKNSQTPFWERLSSMSNEEILKLMSSDERTALQAEFSQFKELSDVPRIMVSDMGWGEAGLGQADTQPQFTCGPPCDASFNWIGLGPASKHIAEHAKHGDYTIKGLCRDMGGSGAAQEFTIPRGASQEFIENGGNFDGVHWNGTSALRLHLREDFGCARARCIGLRCRYYSEGGNKEYCSDPSRNCWNEGCGLSVTGEGVRRVETYYSGPPRNEVERWISIAREAGESEPAPTPTSEGIPGCNLLQNKAPWRAALWDLQWDLIRNSWWMRNVFRIYRQSGTLRQAQQDAFADEQTVYGRNLDETASVTSSTFTIDSNDIRRRRRRLLQRLQGN